MQELIERLNLGRCSAADVIEAALMAGPDDDNADPGDEATS